MFQENFEHVPRILFARSCVLVFALRGYGARVFVVKCEPFCAAIESIATEMDISVFISRVTSTFSLWTTFLDAGHLSFEMSFSFTVQELAQLVLLWNFVENQDLQERCPALAKRTRGESSEIAPSSIRCGALGDSKELLADRARRATVLRARGLLPESSRTRGARRPTVLRHRGLLPPKDLEVEVASPSCKRVASKSAGYDCVINATVPQGTTASTTPPFRRVDCVINETWPRSRGVGPPRVIRHR